MSRTRAPRPNRLTIGTQNVSTNGDSIDNSSEACVHDSGAHMYMTSQCIAMAGVGTGGEQRPIVSNEIRLAACQ